MTSLRCKLGRHAGQEKGGTMMFTCPRCGGSFWQPHDYSVVQRQADALLDRGETDAAYRVVREALERQS